MTSKTFRSSLAALSLGLALCNPSLAGDWVVFHAAPEASLYTDPSTVQKEGDSAKMTVMIDYAQPQMDKTGKQVLSDKVHYLYNCKEKTLSIIGTSAYAGHMGSGELINENPDPPQVTPVEAQTLAEDMWKHACGFAAATQ
ncbi:MAG: hypothetical protein IPG64_21985 [Haliea sp.]|nr:hypothetical protein [Haliea sp.]